MAMRVGQISLWPLLHVSCSSGPRNRLVLRSEELVPEAYNIYKVIS
jgi:hypothetical protein